MSLKKKIVMCLAQVLHCLETLRECTEIAFNTEVHTNELLVFW